MTDSHKHLVCPDCGKSKTKHAVRCPDCVKAWRREYTRKYYQRPDVKAHVREYTRKRRQHPDVKARVREYNQRPKVREHIRKYHQQYFQSHKDQLNVYRRERHQNCLNIGIPSKLIPKELIELRRAQLLLRRELKQSQEGVLQ